MPDNKNPLDNENEEIITLTDEEGCESQFVLLATIEHEGATYAALEPLQDNEDGEYVILKVETDDDDEEMLVTIDDDDEFDSIADAFDDLLFNGEFDDGETD